MFHKALEAANEVLFKRSQEEQEADWVDMPAEQRRADALELLAESALEGGLDPGTAGDRYQVVVHVQGDDHVSAEASCPDGRESLGSGELENGLHVSAETSQRLACDSSLVVMTHEPEGSVLDVGRKTRAIHPALRRALLQRDGGCRFPGCGLHICDAHHIEHWAEGGKTGLDNLVLLCRYHHRALHEGGFRLEPDADGACRFYSPKGWMIPEAPPVPLLKDDAIEALERQHEEIGLEIDASTGFPRWEGGGFDLGYAIDALQLALAKESHAY